MNKKSAQFGFVASPPIIIGAVVIGIIVLLMTTGALKFKASVTKTNDSSNNNTVTTSKKEEPKKVVAKDLTETYTSQAMKLSINYPKGWKIDEIGTNAVIYSMDLNAKDRNTSPAGVILNSSTRTQTKGLSFTTLTNLAKESLSKEFTGMILDSDSDVKVGSYDSHLFKFTYQNGNNTLEGRSYLFATEDRTYVVMGTGLKSIWGEYEETIQKMIESFRIL